MFGFVFLLGHNTLGAQLMAGQCLLRRTNVSFLDVLKIHVISQCLNDDVPNDEAFYSLLVVYHS